MTTVAPAPVPGGRRHLALQTVLTLAVSGLVLWFVLGVLPGVSVSSWAGAVVAAVVIAVASALLRPLLAVVATVLGWIGVVLIGLVAQAIVFFIGLTLAPAVTLSGFWPAFWASWLYALVISAIGWLFDTSDDDLFFRDVVRHARRVGPSSAAAAPGMVVLQIDGLAAPLLRWAIRDGGLPTLSRWVRSGAHTVTEWHAELPPTTPASQAGLLHGQSRAVPAFRWYEKETGRLTVASHPRDAAYIENGMSDGQGLLAGGGTSIGNIFSGDAAQSLLTISRQSPQRPSRSFTASYLRPLGFSRALVLTFGEMAKELYQGYRQRARDVQPRIDRRSSYIALRGVTNVLLRDLNVRLLAEQMIAGTPVMYCDFTDYDEVAHHAGPSRPESLASLTGVDRAIGVLERVASVTARPYRFVVLSDHGQSQGATFAQRYGQSLDSFVQSLLVQLTPPTQQAPVVHPGAGVHAQDEQWGFVGTLLREVGSRRGPAGALCRKVLNKHEVRSAHDATREESSDVLVAASGNLALIYFRRHPERLGYHELARLYPGFIEALVAHEGVGFAVVLSHERGTMAIGQDGVNFVDEGRIEGDDPLAAFGPMAVHDVRRHSQLAHVGDVVVISRLDPDTDEVAAFEELVGCHGGLGGWQSEAVLVHPTDWPVEGPLVGADAVYRQLKGWLATTAPAAPEVPAQAADGGLQRSPAPL